MRQLPPFNFPRLLRYQVINEKFFKKRNVKFSSTDSVCLEECQKQLRSIYEINSKVKIVPWDQSSAVHIDEIYTQLSWLMDEKKPSGVTQKELEHYTDIFYRERLHHTPKRILVHGRPGIGKTVFTQKATFDWSQHRFKGTTGRDRKSVA